jgi:hypothetical protein
MKSFTAPTIAALAAGEVWLATLVKIVFPSGTIVLNSSNFPLAYGGDTYLAAAGLGRVSATEDKPREIAGATLELLRVDSAMISVALDDADEVQGAVVTIMTAILNSAVQVVHVEIDWIGYADTMTIAEDGETCSVGLTAESKAVDLLRGTPLTYTDGDQQSLVPGDVYFDKVVSQSDKPVIWPTKERQFQQ